MNHNTTMNNPEPIFKKIFGQQWESLPLVFQKHYANRPFSNDMTSVEGHMDISFSKWMTLLMPLFRLFNTLVPYQGKHIPVTVNFYSKINSAAFYLDRTFYFLDNKPYRFCSYMQINQSNEVVEMMRFGVGWRIHYFYDGKKVVMQHKGYVWKIGNLYIPLPLEMFVGKGYTEEEVIDDYSYRVTMIMSHALFGTMYIYTGDFKFKS